MTLKPNIHESLDFIKRWYGSEPCTLVAIHPDIKGTIAKTFIPHDEERIKEWLERYSPSHNIYFHPNLLMKGVEKKATREEMRAVICFHLDLDPSEGEDLIAARERMLEAVLDLRPKGVPKPTVIISSGNGIQFFWRLKNKFEINGILDVAEKAKLYNVRLEKLFGGDNCHNIDRIMRLPGTLNIPNAKKRAKGRTVQPASLLEYNENEYDIGDFKPAENDAGGVKALPLSLSGDVRRLSSVEGLNVYGVSERVKVIIMEGRHPEQPKAGDNSRSAWLFDVLCSLKRSGVPDEIIYGVITDKKFLISESVLEHGEGADSYAKRQIERASFFIIDPHLLKMNEQFAVVGDMGGRCKVMEEVFDEVLKRPHFSRQSFEDFRNRHMHIKIQCGESADGKPKLVPLGKWWLEHPSRRQYDRLVFAPNRDIPPHLLNLWRGFSIKPKEGDWSRMKSHIFEVIAGGNQAYYDYIIRWVAFAVQHPAEPAEVALVMLGGKGAGKGVFANAFCRIFGRHGLSISSSSHLVGNFNAHLQDLCLLFADEAFWPGAKKLEGVLKALITEPRLAIEGKGLDVMEVKNCLHIIMASNEEWVVPASMDERRFAVFRVSDKHQQNNAYFEALFAENEAGGLEAMLYDLLHMDIGGWHPRKNIPQTAALNEQKLETLSPIEKAWFSCLSSGDLECHRRYDDVYHVSTKDFAAFVNSLSRYKNTSPHAVGAFFGEPRNRAKKYRCMGFPKEMSRGSKKGYLIPELSIARAMWDKVMFPYSWDGAHEWCATIEDEWY